MKILSIGNSFSIDAQTYVRDIALAGNEEMILGNLYIGGCSLERHMQNVLSGEAAYEYYFNNEYQGVSTIDTALNDDDWDFITLQQASHFSGIWETYEPYLEQLAEYVRGRVPRAEIVIHETWAYEFDSAHGAFPNYRRDRFYMHEQLKSAYKKAAELIGARVIPVGDAVSAARENPAFDPEKGGARLTRDGFHLSMTMGRFLAGAVWYEFFTGKDVRKNPFVPQKFEYRGHGADRVPVDGYSPSAEEMRLLREIAHETVNNAGILRG